MIKKEPINNQYLEYFYSPLTVKHIPKLINFSLGHNEFPVLTANQSTFSFLSKSLNSEFLISDRNNFVFYEVDFSAYKNHFLKGLLSLKGSDWDLLVFSCDDLFISDLLERLSIGYFEFLNWI
jgi:hypothetical protein